MSGFYNVHPTIGEFPAKFPGMDSQQPPFFFGGSQVPLNLGIMKGTGMHTPYESHMDKKRQLPMSGRGTKTTASKHHNIILPVGKL